MSKRNIIRLDDRVKIITPEVVLRCGYNLTKKIVKDTLITQEHRDSIFKMLSEFRGRPEPSPLFKIEEFGETNDKMYDKIVNLMAGELLHRHGFGGEERKIHTIRRESLQGKTAMVVCRKVVKTGKYRAGGGSQDYYSGEWDYEPAYLKDEKTHVLFKVYVDPYQEGVCSGINEEYNETYFENYTDMIGKNHTAPWSGIWMEAKSLEKYDNKVEV